jgi:hypothetical protein
MDFWTQNSWTILLTTISLWTMIHWLIDGVCVNDLKLVRYYNKEAKGPKKLNSKIILMNIWMG